MLVTLFRHGQSEHNAGLSLSLDSKLTSLGEQQASATARRLESEGLTAQNATAFVSPLVRTLQTIEPTVLGLHLHAEVFADVCEYFSERNEGYKTFTGLSTDQIQRQFPWATLGAHIGLGNCWWPQKQEDDQQLYDRLSRVRDQLIDTYFDSGLQLVIVSHADPIGRMIESFLRIPPNMDGPPWSGNCAVTRLDVHSRDKSAEVILLNDQSHLTALSLASPR
jgi:broad specificity phosphatase PhoE